MQMRSDSEIIVMIKALEDVIIPALDPANKLAVEQAHLVTMTLKVMQGQLPMQFRFDHDELTRLVGAAAKLKHVCAEDGEAAEALRHMNAAQAEAQSVLERSRVDPARLLVSIRALRSSISALVAVAGCNDASEAFSPAERVVLDISKEQLLRDRSLLILTGNEIDPAAVPAIGDLVASFE